MLQKPAKLARLVAGFVAQSPLPVTVKVRLGESDARMNYARLLPLLERAGAAAVIVHGRSADARYKRPAKWDAIAAIARDHAVPVIGNGDLLTHYEITHHRQSSDCLALMTGRGALIKPWLFQEVQEVRRGPGRVGGEGLC